MKQEIKYYKRLYKESKEQYNKIHIKYSRYETKEEKALKEQIDKYQTKWHSLAYQLLNYRTMDTYGCVTVSERNHGQANHERAW